MRSLLNNFFLSCGLFFGNGELQNWEGEEEIREAEEKKEEEELQRKNNRNLIYTKKKKHNYDQETKHNRENNATTKLGTLN